MKKLQLLVYLILLTGFIMGYVQGFDTYKKDALKCGEYFDYDYNFYSKFLYWQENGLCCRYALIDNEIKEQCQNGR